MGLLVVTVEAYRSVVSACEGGRGGLVVEGCGVKEGGLVEGGPRPRFGRRVED